MPEIAALTAEAIGRLFWLAALIGALTPIELLLPQGPRASLAGRLQGVVFVVLSVVATTATFWAYGHLLATLHARPLLALDLKRVTAWAGPGSGALTAALALCLSDLVFYWFHRAQHAVPWLWRFHSVHHSIRDMNAVNAYHHISEVVLQTLLVTLPLGYLFAIQTAQLPFVGLGGALWAIAIHSPTRFHVGPLRLLIADNRFHRIHHSTEAQHFDKNFGSVVSIWDTLFGTAYWPRRDEWPETGLADVPEPSSIKEWLLEPFKQRRRASEAPAPAT